MKTTKLREEQASCALYQAEIRTFAPDVWRSLGFSEVTLDGRKQKFAYQGVNLWRIHSFKKESARLKMVVSALTICKHVLAEALLIIDEADPTSRARQLVHLRAILMLSIARIRGVSVEEPFRIDQGSVRHPAALRRLKSRNGLPNMAMSRLSEAARRRCLWSHPLAPLRACTVLTARENVMFELTTGRV